MRLRKGAKRNDRGAMPRGPRAPELDAPRAGDGDERSLWFIAAFEDGKATPDFLAGYEVDLSVALRSGRRPGEG